LVFDTVVTQVTADKRPCGMIFRYQSVPELTFTNTLCWKGLPLFLRPYDS